MLKRSDKKKYTSSAGFPPHLTPEQADQLLQNIVDKLEFQQEPKKKPASSRSCYYRLLRRYVLKNAILLLCTILALIFLMPGTIIPAPISNVEAAPSDDCSSARVEFGVDSLIPVREIRARINNQILKIEERAYQEYSVEVTENGYLLLEVYTMTGLHSSHQILIDSIDDEAPHISSHRLENGNITVYLTDNGGSGVDYSSITSYNPETGEYGKPLYCDEEAGYVVFAYPEQATYLTISDRLGNMMTALLAPPQSSS